MATARPGPPDEVLEHLERILASEAFRNTERLSRFLRVVVEEALRDPGVILKEHRVAMEVFDRPESFDPRADSVVRIAARQLRFKLRDYYDTEGREDRVEIELPKGSYVPVFRKRAAEPAAAPRRWPRLAAALALLAVLGVVGYFYLRKGAAPGPPLTAVAVLPFESLGGDQELQYLTDGIVDELTGALSQSPRLRVLARTSAARFRGARDLAELGRQAGVGAVIEGSVRLEGGSLRVSAQLISTADGFHLWSDTQTLPVAGIRETVRSMAAAVSLRLGAGAAGRAAGELDPEAMQLYWKGRYLRRQRSMDLIRESAQYFERAVARDPRHAAAWTALAEVYSTMGFHQASVRPEDAAARARAALEKAMAADPLNGEAYGIRGFLRFFHDWDWSGAEADLRRAIELNPSYPKARIWYSLLLQSRNRADEAVQQAKAARDLDPLSYVVSIDLGVAYYTSREYEEAIRHSRQTMATDPSYTPAHALSGICYGMQGKYAESVAELETAARGSERYSYLLGRMGYALARQGKTREAERLIAEMTSAGNADSVSLVHLAYIYVGLNRLDRALDLLEQACPRHDADAVFIGVEPLLDPLRTHPRFAGLVARYSFPQQ